MSDDGNSLVRSFNDRFLKNMVDVLFILFETSKMQKLYGKRTERFEVTTSSSAASNKICIRYNMKV